MNTGALSDVEFGDEEGFRDMLDFNALAHETIYRALLESGVVISHSPLFSFGGDDEDWKLVHAREHSAIASALGIASSSIDLETVDFHDADQFDAWIAQHTSHHATIAEALGL